MEKIKFLATVFTFLLLAGCSTTGLKTSSAKMTKDSQSAEFNPLIITAKEIPPSEIHTSESVSNLPLNSRDVIVSAHLDLWLNDHLDELDKNVGKADGRLLLGDFVMVSNGRELVDFVRKNGYAKFVGPTELKLWPRTSPTNIEVNLTIIGKNQKRMTVILYANGGRLGIG